VRPIKVMTETAIPTVFQVELAEVAEAGPAEEVGEGEGVGFQGVMSGTVEPVDDETTELLVDVDRTTAGLVDEDEVEDLVRVGETVEDTEEVIVVGPPGGNRISPRFGRRALVVVGVA